jgi:UPF0755 protein
MSDVVHRPSVEERRAWEDDDGDYQVGDDGEYETFRVSGQHLQRILTGLAVLLAAGLLAAALGVIWIRHQINPVGKPGATVQVTIPTSATTATIASILGRDKVIHSASVFRFYLKVKGSKKLLPGNYSLSRNERYDSVITTLEKGPAVIYDRVTIPEGFTVGQIAARVGTLPGRSAAKFIAAATSGQVRSRYEPAGINGLEGLLFPATYQVARTEDETAILRQMVDKFDSTADSLGIIPAAAKLGVTPYQVITVASIIEREAKLDADRGPVASVIYNRLARGWFLQIDSPVLYGQGQNDPKLENTKLDTPYNNYLHKGLPPTPIASPGVPSLTAAAAPPVTSYMYFVVINPNGQTGFGTTTADFARLQAEAKAKGLG